MFIDKCTDNPQMICLDGYWIGTVYKRDDGRFYALNNTGSRWQPGEDVHGLTPSNDLHPNQLEKTFATERGLKIAFRKAWRKQFGEK